jgi:hypothetical protein
MCLDYKAALTTGIVEAESGRSSFKEDTLVACENNIYNLASIIFYVLNDLNPMKPELKNFLYMKVQKKFKGGRKPLGILDSKYVPKFYKELKKISIETYSTKSEAVGSAGGFEWTKSQIIHDLTLFYKNKKLHFKKIRTETSEKDHFIINDADLGIISIEKALFISIFRMESLNLNENKFYFKNFD